jgi:hypothetical protein
MAASESTNRIAKLDYKKEFKDLYLPKTTPTIIEVPRMTFIMVEGKGDPNQGNGAYSDSMEILYGLSWTIKMSKMSGQQPEGYFEYVVPPLEGLWWIRGFVFKGFAISDKSAFNWISMIRQPEFVTQDVFKWAKTALAKKKPSINFESTRLEVFEEGLCAQIMHKGSYDDEPRSIQKLDAFIAEQGYAPDISDQEEAFPLLRRHHEIYLGDPRKTKPENLKTVIRHPILLRI